MQFQFALILAKQLLQRMRVKTPLTNNISLEL